MGRDRAQLHLGHHRRSEGRRLSPSRRVSARGRQHPHRRAWASIRSICGRCRCSTATAGAFRGRSRWSPARMCACVQVRAKRDLRRASPSTRSRTCAARRSSCRRCSTRRAEEKRALPHVGASSSPPPPRRPSRCWPAMADGRLQRHPSLRPDRSLRARGGQRLARRSGTRSPLPEHARPEGAPGRSLSCARGARRHGPRRRCARARRRRDAWAR